MESKEEDGSAPGQPVMNRPVVKKPYKAPVLTQWGTLRDITQTVGQNGKQDGGGPGGFRNTRR